VPSETGLDGSLEKVQRSSGDKMHLGPERLRAIITETLAAGSFVVCHDTLTYGDFPDYGPAIWRGFFDAYAGQSPALIFLRALQRLTEVPPPGPGSPAAGRRPPETTLPDSSEPDRAASTAEAPGEELPPASSSRHQVIRELMEKRYGPAVPVTDAMIRAVPGGLDQERREHSPGAGAPGGAGAPADGSGSRPAGWGHGPDLSRAARQRAAGLRARQARRAAPAEAFAASPRSGTPAGPGIPTSA
jgi:hypothetical protein